MIKLNSKLNLIELPVLCTHAIRLVLPVIYLACSWSGLTQPSVHQPGDLATTHKPRIIVTSDLGADPDDEQSLVRLLVSSNEFDIEGLIVSTGCWKRTQCPYPVCGSD